MYRYMWLIKQFGLEKYVMDFDVSNPNVIVDYWFTVFGNYSLSLLVPIAMEQQIIKLFNKLAYEKMHTKVLYWLPSESLTAEQERTIAASKLISVAVGLGMKYANTIKALETNITALQARAGITKTKINTDVSVENEQAATVDVIASESSANNDTLSKFNDTGTLGANTNLTTDEYVTNSTRDVGTQGANGETTTNLGARSGAVHTSGAAANNYTEVERMHDIESIANMESLLNDLYGKWAEGVSKTVLALDVNGDA